jgi:hypothetical protein
MRTFLSFLSVVVAVGCAPIPHNVRVMPDISVHMHGTADAPLKLSFTTTYRDTTCQNPVHRVGIGMSDTVVVPGIVKRERWMVLVPYDRLTGFRMCIEQEDNLHTGITHFMFHVPDRVELSCRIPINDSLPLPVHLNPDIAMKYFRNPGEACISGTPRTP